MMPERDANDESSEEPIETRDTGPESMPPDADPFLTLPADEFATRLPETATTDTATNDADATQLHAAAPFLRPNPTRPTRYEAMVRGDQIGDFRIQRLLGKGSFGAVYLARELSLDRLVALKVVLPQGQQAAMGEGRNLARLKHSNIVGVYGESLDRESQCSLLWMQFVDGSTLAGLIRQLHRDQTEATWSENDLLSPVVAATDDTRAEGDSVRSVESVCRIGASLADALEHAHRRGITHRDIKPANILIDRDGTALLADFNLAEETVSCDQSSGGTVAYMPPEQLGQLLGLRDAVTPGPRSDLYALGVVLWELACGERPHARAEARVKAGSAREQLHEFLKIRRESSTASRNGNVPIGLAMILSRALHPDSHKRFHSAAAMSTALRGLSELQQARRRAPSLGGARQFVRRHLFWILLLGGLLPHFAASVLQSRYNYIWVKGIDPLAFKKALIAYNVVVYPACIGWLAWNLFRFRRGYQRVVHREPIPRGELRDLRGRLLKLPRQFMIAAAVGWFPGAIVFPWLLGWFASEPLSSRDTLHLFVSFVIAGLIATTYSYAIVLLIVLCQGYRACWQMASRYRARVRYELRGSQSRIGRLAILAGILPLAAAGMLLAIEIPTIASMPLPADESLWREKTGQMVDLLELVIGLIFFGAIGLYVVEKTSARMIRAVRALTLADD